MTQIKHETTIVISYNGVAGYKPGSHGNGRVVIHRIDPESMGKSSDSEADYFGVFFRTGFANFFNEIKVVDAYVYLGEFDSLNDPRFKAFQAALRSVIAQVKDRSKIHIVGCGCGLRRKQTFCNHEGFDFIVSECGGEDTLGKIVSDILKDVPEEDSPRAEFMLVEEHIFPGIEECGFDSSNHISRFAKIGDVLLAGRSDGQIFWKKNGRWQETPLKLEQGVNVMTQDGESVLVGDGSCCSGATFRLSLDGKVEHILPIDGQDDSGDNIKANVFGFARHNDELLVGGGGCAGAHIYCLNNDGRWEYHPNDPNLYVTAMMSASDGNVYIEMGDFIYRYNGRTFQKLGHVRGHGRTIFEHNGQIYVASTDSGCISPSNFSRGFIYVVEGDSVNEVWSGTGGVRGFFVHEDELYAYGVNESTWNSIVLRQVGSDWELVAQFNGTLEFAEHNGVVYAGGRKETEDKKAQAIIYRVEGF